MFGLALRKNGYHVLEADSGATGLAVARKHLPDLILSDIHMPGGDGSTLLRDLRNDSELKSKQVVLMTGRPDLVTPRNGMEEGADDFLIKPVGIKALLSCMEARFSRASINWRVEDQTLDQLRSSMPSQLPHEFFTPLAGIIGLMEVLRADFSELASDEVQDIHNDVYLSALRLNRTLRNYLLILDQSTSSVLAPPLCHVEVERCLRTGLSEALRQHERVHDVTIRVEACAISVKPEDLGRIVEELVDNAFKFSRQGTPVTVVLGSDGRLVVTDRGRGLTADKVNLIGAFQQFDRAKHEQQGLGLGLVLVQKLTALGHAKFSLASQPGEGTQATVTFPLAASS